MTFATVALIALVMDAVIGWPDMLYRRISHPVVWIGALIARMEGALNHGPPAHRLLFGGVTVAVVVGAAFSAGFALHLMLAQLPLGWMIEGALCWPLIAARGMWDHVAAVIRPLASGDLAGARAAVAMIVGRDVSRANDAAIARAATESLAENTSDGVTAPLFWAAAGGLAGLAAYKAVNTLDSMIGHRDARYLHFGRVAARLDDVANWLPARLTALLFLLAGGHRLRDPGAMIREARAHRSINAGWPEAAMARALNLRLSGPRVYGDRVADEPYINPEGADPDAASLRRALHLYARTVTLAALMLAALALA